MPIQQIRSKLSARATLRGNISVYRNRDIDDVLPSQIVEQQFPEFIRTDYPKMVDFAKAYFNFLEQTENGKIDDLKNLDKTSGEYILRIRNEFAFNATEFNFLEDKEFIRYAKYFYSSKGTEESIKFLFRVMFDEAVEIEYPAERIFKPSTARWFQEQSIKVVLAQNSLPPTDFIGNYLQIRNNQGAEQTIEISDVLDITEKITDEDPSTIFEIFFTTELLIPVSIGDTVFGTELSSTIIPSLTSLKVISPGTNFRIGQVLKLDSITGSGAVAVITNVRGDGEIRNVKFLKFGKNYTTNFYLGISPEGVFTDSGSSFSTTGLADINKAVADITEGFVEKQSILRSDYVLNNSPVTAASPFSNYVYSAYTGVYVSQSTNRQVFFLEQDYSALILSSIGAVCKYPGKYLDQTGMASNASVLQDNNVFQDFSYIIKTTSDVEEYKETITALAHPAGFKMFGELSVENVFDSDTNLPEVTNTSDLYVTDFDFTASDTLDNRITYTRTGTATRVNSAGLVETVAANTPRFDYTPGTLTARGLLIEEARTNLLAHSEDFNNASWLLARATVTANQVASPSGAINADKLVEDTSTTNTHYLYQPIAVTSGTTYTYSVYAKSAERTRISIQAFSTNSAFTSSTAIFNLGTGAITRQDAGFTSATITNSGNGWYRCSISIVATATANGNISLSIADLDGAVTYTGNGVSGIYIWGAQLEAGSAVTSYIPSTVTFTGRASSGTYFDSTGTLQTAATNVARYQYNPSNLSVQPFLLLEEARINKIRNNTMVGAVAGTPGTLPTNWSISTSTNNGITRTVVGNGTENGIDYVDIRYSGTSTGAGNINITSETGTQIVASQGQTWTFSAHLKLVGGSFVNLTANTLYVNGYTDVGAFDANSTNVSGKYSTPTGDALNTQRYWYTGTLSSATSLRVNGGYYATYNSGAVINFTLRIGLPQLELGAFATSVIKTTNAEGSRAADVSTSAAATRGADTAVVTGSNFSSWFNAKNGTLYAEYSRVASVNFQAIAYLGTATQTDYLALGFGSAAPTNNQRFDVGVGGVSQASIVVLTTPPLNTIAKTAGTYALNNFAATANGAVPVTDTIGTIPNVTMLGLGTGTALAGPFLNGYLRRFKYYPVTFSGVELQALTA